MKIADQMLEQLADLIKQQPDYKPALGAWVSIYRSSQHFGGPEEGGWWYTRTQLEGSKYFPTMEQAEAFLAAAKEQVEQTNRDEAPMRARACASLPDEDEVCCPAGYSEGYIPNDWSDGGNLFICIETQRGISDNMNEGRPHYE